MTTLPSTQKGVGTALAARLGLKIIKCEGHDLVGPCVHCKSSDAFRVHQETGVAYCFSCNSKWSPFRLAEDVLGDCEEAKSLMVELGVLQPNSGKDGQSDDKNAIPPNPIDVIAQQKGVSPGALKVYGAKATGVYNITLPAYGPDGAPCTTMRMFTRGGKGKFEGGKPAGLFFPHDEQGVRLPQPGETWYVVEGPKDPAALHDLELLAVGLNTCRLAAKFARLFADVDVVLIPDRDRAGEEGAEHSARVLHGVARSIRIAVLPAEFKDSGGDDVRDVLRRPDGRQLVEQAIADAKPVEDPDDSNEARGTASATLELPDGDPLVLTVSPTCGKPQRLVIAQRGDVTHKDRINTDSDISRTRFLKKLAGKLSVDGDVLGPIVEPKLTTLADFVDEQTARRETSGNEEQQSHATMAAQLAEEWGTWYTPGKDAYVTIPVGGHKETWPVRSRTFKRYLAKNFYETYETAIASEALGAAVNLIEARALFDGDECQIHVRIAGHDDKVYIDLCDEKWRVVEVTPDGWQGEHFPSVGGNWSGKRPSNRR